MLNAPHFDDDDALSALLVAWMTTVIVWVQLLVFVTQSDGVVDACVIAFLLNKFIRRVRRGIGRD